MSRWDSAAIVPKTSELLPDPDTPVNTVSRRLGSSTLMSLRLLTRAPCTRMRSWRSAATLIGRSCHGSSDDLVAEVGHAGGRNGLHQPEAHVLGELVEEAAAAAEQDGHLVADAPVAQARRQRRGHDAAAHEGDVLVPGGLAGGRDGVLDAGGDQRLRLADLGGGPVAEDEQRRRRVRA